MNSDTESFFSWRARDGHGRGAGGVTDRECQAVDALTAALHGLSPGATGSVRIVRLDRQAEAPRYRHDQVHAKRDAAGNVVLNEESP